jgi:hypothetical protein
VSHPLAQPVAKVDLPAPVREERAPHAENIAAALHPRSAPTRSSPTVKEALRELERAPSGSPRRRRLPHPDARRGRLGAPAQRHQPEARRLAPALPGGLTAFWQPQPSTRSSTPRRSRRASPSTAARSRAGDMVFQVHLAEDGKDFDGARRRAAHAQPAGAQARLLGHRAHRRDRPRDCRAVPQQGDARRKERETKGEDTPALIAEERVRMRRHSDELRRLLRPRASRAASTSGATTAAPRPRRRRGQDRRRGARHVLPEVFDRFKEAAAKATDVKKGTDALFTAENLKGLPSVFAQHRPAARREGQDRLPHRERHAEGGDRPHRGARQLRRHRERPLPHRRVRQGAVRLGLRGRAPARPVAAARRQDRGDQQGPDDRQSSPASKRATRSRTTTCSGRRLPPKKGIEFEELVKASEAFRDTFGSEVKELNAGAIVAELRKEVARNEDAVSVRARDAHGAPPAGRHGARQRHRPDEGHPAGLRGQRHRDVQHEPPKASRTPSSAPPSSSRRSPSRAFTTSSARAGRRACSGAS